MAIASRWVLFMAVLECLDRALSRVVVAFIEVIRGTPLLIQLFIIFTACLRSFVSRRYGLPLSDWASTMRPMKQRIIAPESVGIRRRMDTALALGFEPPLQTIWKIVLPQQFDW